MGIEKMPWIPHFVTTCVRHGLEVTQVSDDIWVTSCPSCYECYGCDGNSTFKCDRDPRGFKLHKAHTAQGVIPPNAGRTFMTDEEVESVLKRYRELDEMFWWRRRVWNDNDTILIYTWKDPNGRREDSEGTALVQ